MEPADLNGDSYSTDHSLSCMFYLYIRRMNIQITYIQIEKKIRHLTGNKRMFANKTFLQLLLTEILGAPTLNTNVKNGCCFGSKFHTDDIKM